MTMAMVLKLPSFQTTAEETHNLVRAALKMPLTTKTSAKLTYQSKHLNDL